jgi:anti-sigma factor RsiW
MTCTRIQTDLDALLDGELDAAAARALERHAAGCADCERALERARTVRAALRALPVPEPRADFFEAALRRARDSTLAAPRYNRRTHVLAGIGGALAAGIAALAVLAFWQPASRGAADLAVVSLNVNESRTVNLVFAAENALDDVSLTVELPPGVELKGYEGQRELTWRTRLQAGDNVLALPLAAVGAGGGPLVAELRSGADRKHFVVTIDIS